MSGFTLVSSETLELTPELAKQFYEMEASPTERECDPARVKHLTEKLANGLFIPCQWAKVKYCGKEYRMNGQHSSATLVAANGEFPDGLKVHLDSYEAADSDAMGVLFRQFDDKKSSRSSLDISGAYQGLHEEIRDVDRKNAWAAVKGIRFSHKQSGDGQAPSGDDVGQLFANRSYDPFIRFIDEILTSKTGELKTDGVIGAMYLTYDAAQERAVEFWGEVAKGGVTAGSAAEMLDETLRKSREQKDSSKKLKPIQQYAICIKAWNCFVDGDTPRGVFKHDAKKPVPELHS